MKILSSTLMLIILTLCLYSCSDSAAETFVEKSQFNPNAGKPISQEEAQAWAKAFADKYPQDLRGYYFSAESYKKVLATPGAAGIRIYMGLNTEGSKVMMLTPTDSTGTTLSSGTTYEFGQACPPYCNGGN